MYIAEGIIFLECCTAMFRSKYPKYQQIFSVFITYIILSGIYLFSNFWLNTFSFFSANVLLIFYLYQITWNSAFFYSGIFTVIMISTELIMMSAMPDQIRNFYMINTSFQIFVIGCIFSKTLYFLGMYLLARLSVRHSAAYKAKAPFNISSLLLIIVPSISVMIASIILAISAELNYPSKFDWLILLSAILLLSLNLIIWIVYNYNQKKSLEFTELQLSLQKETDTVEYYKMLIQQNENQNVLIHDIKKHLQSIALLNEKGETEKITAYINQLTASGSLKTSVRVCDHVLLNAILCRYRRQCKELEISFRTDIRSQTVNFLKDDELTSLFCNLMDNAIEASARIPDAFIELSVSKRPEAKLVVIALLNSCTEDPFSPATGKLLSRKPDPSRHGFGLRSIHRVIKACHGELQQYYTDDTQTFHTVIILKYP